MIPVRSILALGAVPSDRTSATKWLSRNAIPIHLGKSTGGNAEFVQLSDLPEDVRLAYWRRELDRLDVNPGTYDDAAHAVFMQASGKARERAERKAAIGTMLTGLQAKGVKRADRFALVRERFGSKGTSTPVLGRIETALNGVDPINYAPALLDNYRPTKARAEMSEDAWRFYMTMIRDAAPNWPLIEAWRRVRDAGKIAGWAVPGYQTFYRRWNELDEAQRLHARLGNAEAVKVQTIPARRDKTSIHPLEWVSLDGRTQDFWVDWGDGKATRPVMLVLVDAASDTVLDWELSPSENANATVRVIKRVCEKYGIFDNLYPDNGSSFAGHKVAGGAPHRFRNGIAKGIQPLGICKIMGINIHFALPENAKAKIAERVFATLSRSVDDGPEFKGAHAGHAPGASPTTDVVPVPVDVAKAVLAREIGRYNRETGRRSQGARGRSYEAVMRDGLVTREALGQPLRRATADQLYLAGLHWKPATVDRNTQITVSGWTYGAPDTRKALEPYSKGGPENPKGGVQIIFGRDPDDYSAPGIAYNAAGNLICRGIEPVKPGKYGSEDGVRQARKNNQAARKATKAAAIANDYLDDEAYRAAVAALNTSAGAAETPLPPRKIVGGRFGPPLQDRATGETAQDVLNIREEFERRLANMDRADAARAR